MKAPAGYAFDPNLHTYVKVQQNVTTNPNATGYISSVPLNKTGNYCNASHPYFDGVACIQCLAPFPYFNVSSKTCVQCSATTYYDNKTHQCLKRPVVYISANFTNVMATANVSLSAYKNQLYNMVKNNNNSIIKSCPPGQYSNFTHCFSCASGLLFNIETKSCMKCNGTVLNNLTCYIPKFVTNVTALNATKRVLTYKNVTLLSLQNSIKKILLPVKECPKLFPLFNGTSCVACPNGTYYLLRDNRCYIPQFVSNITALNNTKLFVNIGNATLTNLAANISMLKLPHVECPPSAPLFNGSVCLTCPSGTYYLI